ncbi:MAG: hypothetical protein FWG10_00520 [Eubacteriaceae bacterium]|nr:hypothetical protein [Eubacteriaceae bacterium]
MAEDKQAKTKENFFNAINHIEPDYVPKAINGSNAILDFAGMTFTEAEYDPEKTEQVFRNLFENIPLDVGNIGFNASPKTYVALNNRTETFLAPDGVTLQHLQKPPMKADEYPELIAGVDKFVKETLLPRKYPELFDGGKEGAKDKIKTIVDESASRIQGHYTQIQQKMYAEYGFFPYPTTITPRFCTPIDIVFDRMRGFVGTIADLRRRPAEVHAALDAIFALRGTDYSDIQVTGLFTSYMSHIPCYLNPKQYDEFFWPYFKLQVTNLGNSGNKLWIFIEGHWLPFIESFLDLPKDSLYNLVDDDDILDLVKVAGHHQSFIGGIVMQNAKLYPLQKNIDYAKKVIDECAPGGGFVFGNNKSAVCKGDINQNVVDLYKFADDYGRK